MFQKRSLSSDKSFKTLRIKRKLDNLSISPDYINDFLLESGGEITNFLKPEPHFLDTLSPKSLPFSLVGSPIIMSNASKTPYYRTPKRKVTGPSQVIYRKSLINNAVDHEGRFNEIMKKINEAAEKSKKEQSLEEENSRLKSLNAKDSQTKGLTSLKSIGKLLETGKTNRKSVSHIIKLPKISGKATAKPEIKTNDYGDNLLWYMSLRGDKYSKQIESYMRIGDELNGLYTKFKKSNPLYKEKSKPFDINELNIVGKNKLALEIEAVKKVGYEHLCPDLLQLNSNPSYEEIIAEHHSDSSELML